MKTYASAPSGAVERARELRRAATEAEKVLWRKLRENFPQAKFRRQSPVGPYIADFLSIRHALVIEVDGGQHAEQAGYDARRSGYLEAHGLRVVRFWNNEVLEQTESVIHAIAQALTLYPPTR